jgi:cytochrome c556
MHRKAPSYLLSASLAILVTTAGIKASGSIRAPLTPEAAVPLVEADVEAIVDHRKGIMRAASGHMRASAGVLVDGLPFEGMLPMHGMALATLLSDLTAFFPEGSAHSESAARPAVWENWEEFQTRARTTAERAAAFEEAVR